MLDELMAHDNAMRVIAFARGRRILPILPTSAGIELRDHPDYCWDGLKRGNARFVVLQHTIAGEGHLQYEDRHFLLQPGSTMLVRIPHAHSYFVAPGAAWRFFFFVLAGRDALEMSEEIVRSAGPVLTLTPTTVDRLAGLCLDLVNNGAMSPGTASSIAYETMSLLVDHVTSDGAHGGEDWVAPVIAHVAKNLDRPLNVDALAEISGLSRAHFVRQFTRQVGASPAEYVFRKRMEKAVRLLEVSNAGIGDIARQCGFANANYFAKAFRRAFDVSPTEFRASGMYSTKPHVSDEG